MAALAKAQGSFPDIERDRTVTVKPRAGGDYSFKYATLAAIIKGIKKALSDNGIAYTQVLTFDINDRLYYLTTNLHCGNQFISSVTPLIIGEVAGNQQFGSALTYMKRYALAALVGVAADEDDDGNMADGNEVKAMQETAKPTKKVAPDPITPDPITTGMIAPEGMKYNAWSPAFLETPMVPDGSAVDWMAWGRAFMDHARSAPSVDALRAFEDANMKAIKGMEDEAPKMFTNFSMSLMRVRNSMEKKNVG